MCEREADAGELRRCIAGGAEASSASLALRATGWFPSPRGQAGEEPELACVDLRPRSQPMDWSQWYANAVCLPR